MNTSRLVASILTLTLFAGCASDSEPSQDTASNPASESTPASLPVALDDLQGEWTRDDGKRYRIVRDGDRLIGYRIGEEHYGCRVVLTLNHSTVRGTATFIDAQENPETVLEADWELDVQAEDRLRGKVGAWDVDPATGEALAETVEEHTYDRGRAWSDEEAASCREVARVHLDLDAAVRSDDRDARIAALMTGGAVEALEANPNRESVGDRLKALFKRMTRAPSTVAAAAPRAEVVAARAAGSGQTDFRCAWTDGPIKTMADLTLGDAHGWEGEFNQAMDSWTFEKYTPGEDGFNAVNRFYLDAFPGDAPSDVEGYALKLVTDEDFQDYGYRYREVSRKDTTETGFLIEGAVVDASDPEETEPGFVLALVVGKFRLLAKGSTFQTESLRAEAIRLCEALVPVLEASSSGSSHSAGHGEEMKAFLARFDGGSEAVEAALAAVGIVGLDTQDMHYYSLGEPKVVASEPGAIDWFTFDAKAGMTVRTYRVGWKGGSIVTVEDKGMR